MIFSRPDRGRFHLPERTCKVFTRIYGRFSIHNRSVPWKIKRHPSWPRMSACQSIDASRHSLFFFFFPVSPVPVLFSYSRRRDVSLWFPGPPLLLHLVSFYYFYSPFFFRRPGSLGSRHGKGTLRRYRCRIFAWKMLHLAPREPLR